MILTLDVGNTQIYGGVFNGDAIKATFRKTSKPNFTSDELGIFLKQVLRENGIEPESIKEIGIASVVPDLNYTLGNCCRKYFDLEPFMIAPGIKTGIHIKGPAAATLGADRVATALAAVNLYPKENLIVIDFGTANTFDAVSKNREYLGGAIQIGLGTALNALTQNTAQLKRVEILKPAAATGLNTESQMQSGLYYGTLGAMKEFVYRFKKECFAGEDVKIIATGGLGRMFENENILDSYQPDLVLLGIKAALENNR